jgi:hypothetical protein
VDQTKFHIDVGGGGLTPLNPTGAALTQTSSPYKITLTFSGTPFSSDYISYSASEGLYLDANAVTGSSKSNAVVLHDSSIEISNSCPVLIWAVFTTKTELTLYFDKSLGAASTVEESAITITNNNGSSISVTDNSAVVTGSMLKINVSDVGSTAFKIDAAGQGVDLAINAVSHSGGAGHNRVSLNNPVDDGIKPTFTALRTALNTIVLNFSEPVTGSAINNSFTVSGSSSVNNTAPVSNATIILTTVGLNGSNLTRYVNYVEATGDICDLAGNEILDGGSILISDQLPILINITSWGNNFTNDQDLSLTLDQLNKNVNFNISTNINSDLTIWNVNGANQSQNFNNLTYDFSSNGNYTINSIVYNSTWGNYDYKNWTITVTESSTPEGSVTQGDLDSIRSELNGLGVLFINFMICVLIMNKKNYI